MVISSLPALLLQRVENQSAQSRSRRGCHGVIFDLVHKAAVDFVNIASAVKIQEREALDGQTRASTGASVIVNGWNDYQTRIIRGDVRRVFCCSAARLCKRRVSLTFNGL